MWQSNKKILLTGAAGQLGNALLSNASDDNLVALARQQLDLGDTDKIVQALNAETPAIVINCAAWTAVDAAEDNQETAFAVNAEAPRILANWCIQNNAYLLHVSTDYVFSGNKPLFEPYSETDQPDPVSVYGKSKLLGEQYIVNSGIQQYAILRTAWLYGAVGKNFLKTMLRLVLADPARELKVVDDQYGSPTSVDAVARQISAVLGNQLQGIYHATAHGFCSWYSFACEFFSLLNLPHNLEPCTTSEYPTPASRPENSILENTRLAEQDCDTFLSWQDELKLFVEANGQRLLDEASAVIEQKS
jgi:dTDP-4-dehydrorhamnose reductase